MIAHRADAMTSMKGFNEMGAVTRHKTTGARNRVLSRLKAAGEITDPSGLASATLAKAVDYPGSSAAFAQLLSSMERDGLIEREVRGKRTYRIRLADGAGKPPGGEMRPAGTASADDDAPVQEQEPGLGLASARDGQEPGPRSGAAAAFDYSELAMRLLEQVVRRITAAPDEGFPPDEAPPAGRELPGSGPGPRGEDLALTLVSLERRLTRIQSRQRELSEETAMLREQLAAAQRSLAEVQAGSAGGRLDPGERQVLQRLLSSLHAAPARRRNAEAG